MFSRGRNFSSSPAPSRILIAVPTADSFRSMPADSLISAWVSSIGSESSAEEVENLKDHLGGGYSFSMNISWRNRSPSAKSKTQRAELPSRPARPAS